SIRAIRAPLVRDRPRGGVLFGDRGRGCDRGAFRSHWVGPDPPDHRGCLSARPWRQMPGPLATPARLPHLLLRSGRPALAGAAYRGPAGGITATTRRAAGPLFLCRVADRAEGALERPVLSVVLQAVPLLDGQRRQFKAPRM